MLRILNHLILAAAVLGLASAPCLGASTSPGKNSVFASDNTGATLPGGCSSSLLTATIAKGKPKRVLSVEAMLHTSLNSNAVAVCLELLVNGIAVEPTDGNYFAVAQSCDANEECAVTVPFWLDLDAAETANPGMFKGQPLNIELRGGGFGAPDGAYHTSLSARMEKK